MNVSHKAVRPKATISHNYKLRAGLLHALLHAAGETLCRLSVFMSIMARCGRRKKKQKNHALCVCVTASVLHYKPLVCGQIFCLVLNCDVFPSSFGVTKKNIYFVESVTFSPCSPSVCTDSTVCPPSQT